MNTSDLGGFYVTPKIRSPTDNAVSMNYKVPNFGADPDMVATKKHIKDSEKKLKHKWNPKKKVKSYPTNYKVPNFGLDRDIIDSVASIKSTEK